MLVARSLIRLFLVLLAIGLAAAPARAQNQATEQSAAALVTPPADRAIEQGLAFLASRQQNDGSFGSGAYRGNVAVTALAGMAFMAGGSTPDRGPYGENVSRTIDYLLANTQQSGFIVAPGSVTHGPMYGHGFAALFLAESYGMTNRPDLREKLDKAIALIVNTQNQEGGWRYQPQRADADISVTICQVMALRSAHNAGLHVPKETIDRCVDYVKRCQNPDGGFSYMLQGGESAFARSAAGVVALYSAGVYQGPEITKGLEYLTQFTPAPGVSLNDPYYFYGHYYAVQAMWHAGDKHWEKWYPAIRDELVSRKRPNGSWIDPIDVDYGTAMACIILQVPNNYLPILQR